MLVNRFVTAPWKVRVEYEPYNVFRKRAEAVWLKYAAEHGRPNVCYVSASFAASLPRPMNGMVFKRQTLLGVDEVIIGVEDTVELGEVDEVTERSIG